MNLAVLDRISGSESGNPGVCGRRLALTLEYAGRRYAGSQYQPVHATVQGMVEQALLKLTGERIRVSMAGRTDAGAHASGQVVSFITGSTLATAAFVHGLNRFLPEDIAVKAAKEVELSFDPRRHARRREYIYRILNTDIRSPLWKERAFQVAGCLDVGSMQEAAQYIVGTHDFASFTVPMKAGKTTRRQVFEAGVARDGDMITVRIVANSYLPHQVRYLVGTLLRVGHKKLSVEEFKTLLNEAQPGLSGPVVPAFGLYLNHIDYTEDLKEN